VGTDQPIYSLHPDRRSDCSRTDNIPDETQKTTEKAQKLLDYLIIKQLLL